MFLFMSDDPERKAALIIGASRGLGLRLTQHYLERNWRVLATVRQPSARLAELARGDDALEIATLDVTEPEQIAALRRRLTGRALDLLFVIAGVANDPGETIGNVATDEFVRVMVTNALGPMRCIEAFSSLVQKDGTIAAMSSGLASVGNNLDGGWEVYRASKAALNTLVRSFAARRPSPRQTILAIAPGWSRTEMGGGDAPLDPDDSVRGVVAAVTALAGSGVEAFVDYRGERVPW
jgi:NAD(P)-dependent dehydrogenase (short-subunit alcohol dehydrogenase family)